MKINFHGWVAGAIKNKAIPASNEVEVEVEAELGSISYVPVHL